MRPITLFFLLQAVALHAQGPDLVGYWQNWSDANAPYIDLDEVDPRYTVIELAFAEPLAGTSYNMQFVPDQALPSAIVAQIGQLHSEGRKVLISVGGANVDLHLGTDEERDQFVGSVLSIISTYDLDGIDLDLEGNSVSVSGGTISEPVDTPVVRIIDGVKAIMTQFRTWYHHRMWLTMAPETYAVQGGQSAFSGGWGAQLPIIDALRDSLDILQVQLYNSGTMYGIDGNIYSVGTADFIVSQTEAVLQGFQTAGGWFAPLPPEKVAIGLPACANAAGSGYTAPADVAAAVNYLRGEGPPPGAYTTLAQYPTLRGMMTWSINWDGASSCNSQGAFADNYASLFDASSGISEASRTDPVTLLPNPVIAGGTVRAQGTHADDVIRIFTTMGAQVNVLVYVENGSVEIGIPATVAPGVYLLRVQQHDGRTRSAHLIVM